MKQFISLILLLLGLRLSAQWSPFGTGIATNDFVIGMVDYQGSLLAYTYPNPTLYEWERRRTRNTPMPPVPNGGGIHKLAVVDSVPLGGDLCHSGPTTCVHRWDGSQWVQVGRSFLQLGIECAVPSMYDLVTFRDTLYVAWRLCLHGTDTINGIAKLVDSICAPRGGITGGMLYTQVPSYPHQMLVLNNELGGARQFPNGRMDRWYRPLGWHPVAGIRQRIQWLIVWSSESVVMASCTWVAKSHAGGWQSCEMHREMERKYLGGSRNWGWRL
ncbi:MAG: hypothetical protein U0176_24500 [Bacteroidia bacterium]